MFAVREFGFGSLQFQQSAFPFCFESTRDESILRVHGAIASLGALRVVARTLDVATMQKHPLTAGITFALGALPQPLLDLANSAIGFLR